MVQFRIKFIESLQNTNVLSMLKVIDKTGVFWHAQTIVKIDSFDTSSLTIQQIMQISDPKPWESTAGRI